MQPTSEPVAPFLSMHKIAKDFGGLRALDNVTATVERSDITSLIGPNGSGKTTMFNIISGLYRPTGGHVAFEGKTLTDLHSSKIASHGIARTFQVPVLLHEMTVLQNVMLGMFCRTKADFLGVGFNLFSARREERLAKEQALAYLEFVGLAEQASAIATDLSFGQQRLVEIARALVSNPKILLLDEPAAGFDQAETEGLAELFLKIKNHGVTVFLIDHDMNLVMNISSQIIVLSYGQFITKGTPTEVQSDKRVLEAYLGGV